MKRGRLVQQLVGRRIMMSIAKSVGRAHRLVFLTKGEEEIERLAVRLRRYANRGSPAVAVHRTGPDALPYGPRSPPSLVRAPQAPQRTRDRSRRWESLSV